MRRFGRGLSDSSLQPNPAMPALVITNRLVLEGDRSNECAASDGGARARLRPGQTPHGHAIANCVVFGALKRVLCPCFQETLPWLSTRNVRISILLCLMACLSECCICSVATDGLFNAALHWAEPRVARFDIHEKESLDSVLPSKPREHEIIDRLKQGSAVARLVGEGRKRGHNLLDEPRLTASAVRRAVLVIRLLAVRPYAAGFASACRQAPQWPSSGSSQSIANSTASERRNSAM
jgi:hypothetical protein